MTPFSLLTLLLLLTTSVSLSSAAYTYTFLNVSSSLHSTLSLFSSSSHSQSHSQAQQQTLGLNQHHSLTLQLHPRASLHPPSSFHTNYKSLTHSRLARDNARAVSLYSKATLALRGLTHADLSTPQYVTDQYQQSELQAPVTSGTSQGSGEYFSRVGVGSPTKDYYLVIDTGSDVSWIQCQPCTDCYQQSDPIYNPSSSSSYSPISCSSRQCSSLEVSACRRETCLYQVSYGDGSYTVGDFVFETLSFTAGAGAATGGSIPRIALGCGHDNQGLFVGAAGLLGLGGGPLSLTSQLRASSFSYCLVDRDSSRSSTLEFNSEAPLSSSAVTAPLLRNDKLNTFYYIGLEGISVGGQQVAIPPALFSMDESGAGGVIVDSGTAITRLPSQAYNSLRNAFTRLSQHLRPASGVALFDTCYDFSRVSSVRVPTVAMHFSGGHSLNLPAKNYLIPVDSAGTFCFAFAETTSSMSIIGNVQQQGTRVHFDLQSNEVSFSLNNC